MYGVEPVLIVGLGNPGKEYSGTRHNVGFMVIDSITKKYDIKMRGGKGPYRIGKGEVGGRAVLCSKPLTFMNLSGTAVIDLVNRYSINPVTNLLVVCDDLNLPLGKIRFRKKGSDGGNRGLRSIIGSLCSQDFCRLRLGIRTVELSVDFPDFVLSRFGEGEFRPVREMISHACDAVALWAKEGIEAAMNRYNSAPSADKQDDAE